MPNNDLAALSEAATQEACAEAGVVYAWYQWQKAKRPTIAPPAIDDMDGFLYNAVTALALRIEAERAGRLVHIDEGMRERADTAWHKWVCEEGPAEAWDPQAIFDAGWDAAIAAMMGEKP